MIVELTGIPAVGKSTLIRAILDKRPDSMVIFSYDMILSTYHVNFITNTLLRKTVSEMILFILFIVNINLYISFLTESLNTVFSTNEHLTTKLNILRNFVIKIGTFQFLHAHYGNVLVIIDEGISHIPFNCLDYHGKRELDLVPLFKPLVSVTRNIVVVHLERDPEAVEAALTSRGHRRLQGHARYTVAQFMDRNRRLSAAFASLPEGLFLRKLELRLGAENDAQSLIHLLESELLK